MSPVPITYGPPTVLWAGVVYTFGPLRRRPRQLGLQSYWLTLLLLALTFTVLLQPIYLAIDRLVAVPNLARLIGNELGVGACWTVQRFMHYLVEDDHPSRLSSRWHVWVVIGTMGLLAGLFAAAPVSHEAVDFTQRYGANPIIFVYRLVLLVYVGLTLVEVTRGSWRYAAIATEPSMRLGLRLDAAGGIVGLGYVNHEILYDIALRCGVSYPLGNPLVIPDTLLTVAAGLFVVGSTMPLWGRHLGILGLTQWASEYRSLRRLYPLWLALYQATPDIALLPVRSALTDALTFRDLHFRLYRRVIEIHDGILVLHAYMGSQTIAVAHEECVKAGIPETDVPAAMEAASLAAAIHAKALGEVPWQPRDAWGPLGGIDMTADVAILEQVAYYFQHAQVTTAVLTRLSSEAVQADAEISEGSP